MVPNNKIEQLKTIHRNKQCECAPSLSNYLIVLHSPFLLCWCEIIKVPHEKMSEGNDVGIVY